MTRRCVEKLQSVLARALHAHSVSALDAHNPTTNERIFAI
jgi:hypothetical protein